MTILQPYENSLAISRAGARLPHVGCRGCKMKPYVSQLAHYEGADLAQNSQETVDSIEDIEQWITAFTQHYDFVVKLDAVEHPKNPVAALDELLRLTHHQNCAAHRTALQ